MKEDRMHLRGSFHRESARLITERLLVKVQPPQPVLKLADRRSESFGRLVPNPAGFEHLPW